ncbi:DUF3649 domain-containing protein [Pseudomonas sp. Irchel s3h17]|uniref:DUF3649 domain-containing protein n=1 Tax=Pseudomonas sp. Irchel s3h17 TaxID=2009182 RepID=UPI000BA39B35|nr:DUF3649 domain-containing protein [Pseudomonas sp. Irchel s3h17]
MKSLPISYRMAVTSRVLAALLGGYILAALASICMGLWLPMPRAEAVLSGMMTSFLVYLVAVLWCFACRSAWQAWSGVMVPSLVLAALIGLGYWLGQS